MTFPILRSTLAAAIILAASSTVRAADVAHGQQVFQACAACHSPHPGGDLGPDLAGVVGRKAGSRDDYRYSNAMKRASFVWDEAKLHAFIHDPQQTVKGTRMPYDGMANDGDVDDLVAYLATLK